jgi:hypothetical protein
MKAKRGNAAEKLTLELKILRTLWSFVAAADWWKANLLCGVCAQALRQNRGKQDAVK